MKWLRSFLGFNTMLIGLEFTLLILCFSQTRLTADEGMFPISEIMSLALREKGLEMDPADIFNAEKTCLVDGICRVNGCTGSFVSPQGLIITNHHCAFDAIQSASTTEHDYLANGFIAKNHREEIFAPGYTVRITESFEDVSQNVLRVVTPDMSFIERTKAIDKQKKQVEKDAEAAHPGMRAEVAEMFVGERYVLFLYTFIKDVRLVFAPPSSIGNFGGEVDNWEWPRHTGDFSFMRAYVSPEGTSAEYSPDNVPYQPKRFIKVQQNGVNEGDFVMLLGYPGRTVRHNTASFLNYEEQVRLPFIVDLYAWEIAAMESAGQADRAVALKLAARIKSLANVEKRSRGQLKGLRRLQFVAKRKAEEEQLQSFIDSDPLRKAKFGKLLSDIDRVYDEMAATADLELTLKNLTAASQMLSVAFSVVDAANERLKNDLERETNFTDRNFELTKQRVLLQQRDIHLATDKIMLVEMLNRLAKAKGAENVEPFAKVLAAPAEINDFVQHLFASSRLADADFLKGCLSKTPSELSGIDDPVLALMTQLYPTFISMRERDKDREGRLSQMYGELFNIKREYFQSAGNSQGILVPDANSTLRLTYGKIEGYNPEDAVYMYPITSLQGMLDKTTGIDPFITPEKISRMHELREFGNYASKVIDDIPVAILYSTDTTGGNSGSPILNGRGELVGVNFDRTFDATINDFAWNKDYSRSIGVDIRYVLWITHKVYGAEHLIKEMDVE